MMPRLLRIVIIAVLALFCEDGLWAQAVAVAQIEGVVLDPSGKSVPNAQVIARQISTNFTRTTVSGADGTYVLPNLPLGPYRLEVSAPGFTTYVQSGIELHVDDKIDLNVTMRVGASAEHVEVAANASLVETQKISVSGVVEQQRIVDLPLNGRQPMQLLLLEGAAAPVTSGVPAFDLTGARAYALETPYAVAGGQANTTNYLLDGADNNDAAVNVALPYPFPDALQEFEVETSARSARLGLHPGAVVNVVTKSGSNQFHGNLFEFLRNGDLNARNFFAAGQDTLKRNQFGGTFGGRIVKDRLFFFGGYQGTRNRSAVPASTSFVPNSAMLQGNFGTFESAGCQSSGKARTIIDPSTGQPFPNDLVPTSRFNPSALALLKYVPMSSDPCGKIVYAKPTTGDENQEIGRVDWVQNSKHLLFGRYFKADYSNPSVFNGSNILPAQRTGLVEHAQTAALGDTYSLTANSINEVHLAFTRLLIIRGAPSNYISPHTIGVDIPIAVPNYLQLSVNGDFSSGPGSPYYTPNNAFQFADDIDLVRGRHHLSFGGEFIRNQMNENNNYIRNGVFTFDGSYTGDPMVDFMLGDLGILQQGSAEIGYWRQSVVGLYGQDNFRLNSQLTVTAGLRWEPYLPSTDTQGRGNYFSPSAFAAGTKTNRYVNAPPGLLFNSDPGIPHGYTSNHLADLEPRVGLAWDPSGKGLESIRVSYSRIYDTPCIFYFDSVSDNSPWGATIVVNHPPGGFNSPWAGYPGGTPFPLPLPPSPTTPFPLANTYQNMPLHIVPSDMQQWSITYQRQFGHDWLASASYMGNKTTHQWIGIDENPAVYIPGTCNGQACSTVANTQSRRVLSLENPAGGAYYGSVPAPYGGGNGEYEGLLLSIRHRFSHNYMILGNYTYSHCINEADNPGDMYQSAVQNPNNVAADRGNCVADYRHIFNLSLVAATSGIGQTWIRHVTGDWQLSPIVSARSGQSFTVYTGLDNSLTAINQDRPDVVSSNPYPAKQGISDWINPSAFIRNPLGTYGNMGRDALLGPGILQVDMALSRNFRVTETMHLETRFEAFNVINHANFAIPSNTMTSSTFGRILSAGDPRILQFALKFSY